MRTFEEIAAEYTARTNALIAESKATGEMTDEEAVMFLAELPRMIQNTWEAQKARTATKPTTSAKCMPGLTFQQVTQRAVKQATQQALPLFEESTRQTLTRREEATPAQVSAENLVLKEREKRNRQQEAAQSQALCRNCTGNCRQEMRYYYLRYEYDEKRDWHSVRSCKCHFGVQADLMRRIRSSKIPDRYVGKTLDDYICDESNRDGVHYARNFRNLQKGAWLYGNCGTGKTLLAAIIAQEFVRDGKSVVFVTVPALLNDIRSTFDKTRSFGRDNSDELKKIYYALEQSDLVVFDDFGMEKSTQWVSETLCQIIDMRYRCRDATTIITSNYSPKQLEAHLNNSYDGENYNGTRLVDRCVEMCYPIFFTGGSRRH